MPKKKPFEDRNIRGDDKSSHFDLCKFGQIYLGTAEYVSKHIPSDFILGRRLKKCIPDTKGPNRVEKSQGSHRNFLRKNAQIPSEIGHLSPKQLRT